MINNEPILKKSETDWARIDAMSDEDIDFSDCPEITPEMFAKAIVRRAPSQVQQNVAVVDDGDTWMEEDISDLVSFSLQYAEIIYPDDEELI
jgi:hypothetical protein